MSVDMCMAMCRRMWEDKRGLMCIDICCRGRMCIDISCRGPHVYRHMLQGFLAAFAPRRLKNMVMAIEELRLPPVMSLRKLDLTSAASLGAVISIMCVIIPGLIIPFGNTLQDARDALCAGKLTCP